MPQVKKKACCVHETEMAAESTQYPESSLDKEEKEKRGSELGCVKKTVTEHLTTQLHWKISSANAGKKS